MDSTLEEQLFALNTSEIRHKKTNYISTFYDRLSRKEVNGQLVYVFDDLIPDDKNIVVTKHNRFAPVPNHTHTFIEINYVYNGSVTQVIDSKIVTLEKGECCLIDTEIPHEILEAGEEDIVINILISKNFFRESFSINNFGKSIVTDFILNSISESKSHDQYIIFKQDNSTLFEKNIDLLLQEYLQSTIGSEALTENYVKNLLVLLVRNFSFSTNKNLSTSNEAILNVLKYIETNYQQCTLKVIAKSLGYSPNYLSSLIKKELGASFSELLLNRRLTLANEQLKYKDRSIVEIANSIGIHNMTFFYRKYKNEFGILPSERE